MHYAATNNDTQKNKRKSRTARFAVVRSGAVSCRPVLHRCARTRPDNSLLNSYIVRARACRKNTTRVLARVLSALADSTPECIQIITHTTQICGYALLRMFPIYLALSGRASPACASTPRRSSRCLRVRVRAVRTHASSTHGDTCARNRIYMSDCGPTDRPTARPPARLQCSPRLVRTREI